MEEIHDSGVYHKRGSAWGARRRKYQIDCISSSQRCRRGKHHCYVALKRRSVANSTIARYYFSIKVFVFHLLIKLSSTYLYRKVYDVSLKHTKIDMRQSYNFFEADFSESLQLRSLSAPVTLTESSGEETHRYCSTSGSTLTISEFHPNCSTSSDAGICWILPEVVWRKFSDSDSFFLQTVIQWFVSRNVVGLSLCSCATRNGSHMSACALGGNGTTSCRSKLTVVLHLLSLPWFHTCLNVKMCALTSMKYACLSSYKDILTTCLILHSVFYFADN